MFGLDSGQILTALLALIAVIGPLVASKMTRDGKKLDSSVQLATLALGEKEKFQTNVLAQLDKVQIKADTLAEKVAAQAIQIAELRAEVLGLKHSEGHYREENARLSAENVALRARNERLNDEAEAQAQAISQLIGRLQVYEPGSKGPDIRI